MKPFIQKNQSVIELAPLQVYSSALALAPVTCKVRMQFIDTIPGWIQQLHGMSDTYDRTVEILGKHEEPVQAIVFSRDGNYLASASNDGIIWLWNVTDPEIVPVRQFCPPITISRKSQTPPLKRRFDFYYSGNGKRLALCDRYGRFILWDAESGKILKELRSGRYNVRAIAFSPCSNQLALASGDHLIRLWDDSGNNIGTLEGIGEYSHVTYSQDGERLAAWCYGGISLWDCKSRRIISMISESSGCTGSVTFSQDGTRLVALIGGTIWLWDGRSGEGVGTLQGHCSYSFSVSPDGKWLASYSTDHTIRLWNGRSGDNLEKLTIYRKATEIIFTPDSKGLALHVDSTVEIWNHESGLLLKRLPRDFIKPRALTFSPNGKWLAFTSDTHPLSLWDYKSDAQITSVQHHSARVASVAFSQDGQRLASASSDNSIKLWDSDSGVVLNTFTFTGHEKEITAVAFSPNDKWLASASWDGTIRLWDFMSENTTECYRTVNSSTGRPPFDIDIVRSRNIAFSPDGKRIASASLDGSIRLWDIESGTLTASSSFSRRWVTFLDFSPDGRRLASCDIRGEIFEHWFVENSESVCPGTADAVPQWYCSCDGSYIQFSDFFVRLGWASSPRFSSSSRSEQDGFDLSVSEKWMAIGKDDFFYLPGDFRPSCVAIKGRKIALGHKSGRVSFFCFNTRLKVD